MIGQRSVTRKFYSMLKKHSGPVVGSKINCYKCICSHITKTIDVDDGVTPAWFPCEKCGELAGSTFYKDIAPDQHPTVEWYRPDLRIVLKMRRKPGLLDHILNGGLVDRRIKRT